MRKPIAFAALCACMALMSGCLATEQHIDNMQDQLNELSASLSAMNKKQAELNAKLDTVSNSLSAHAETLRDFDDQMSKLSAKMDDVQSGITEATGDMNRLSSQVQAAQQQSAATQAALIAAQNQQAAAPQNVPAAAVPEKKTGEPVALTPSKLYAEAYSQMMRKNFDRAVDGFQVYIDKYPKGELAESAYYHLGDSYAGLGKWQDAAVAYAQLLDKYKNSQYTAPCRIKYAQSILKLNEKKHFDEARRYLKSVMQDFPNTESAKMAAKYLKEAEQARKSSKRRK